jgi:hypothetical protein
MSHLPLLRNTLLLASLLLHSTPLSSAQTGGNLSNCKGGCTLGETCIGNPFSQPVTDDDCNNCAGSRYWWPCNFETLCYCNSAEENAPRIPPAPKSGLEVYNENITDPCSNGILTQEIFNAIVQPPTSSSITNTSSSEGMLLYTYEGLCNAIMQYNMNHDEQFANMGDETQVRSELAAFLSHAAVDTHGFSITREENHCLNPITGSDGMVYCQPCRLEDYNAETKTCSQSYFTESGPSYAEYCDATRQPPEGCACSIDSVTEATNTNGMSGYMSASSAFFTRGALSVSWNYDYYAASQSMTGNANTLCDNPDLVSTNAQVAWFVGLYKWMEKMQFGTQGSTAHKQALKGNFGGTVEALYAELECPANEWSSAAHVSMIHDRINYVCKAGAALGVYLEMNECVDDPSDCLECDGLKELYDACIVDGTCPDCQTWTQFVRSSAPSVTPQRIEPPEDWGAFYGATSDGTVGTPPWFAVSSSFLLFLTAVILLQTI